MATELVARVRLLAIELLRPLPGRWAHSAAVAASVADAGARLQLAEQEELTAAGWLHDIGYAPALSRTGIHALDGASFLHDAGASSLIVSLVAHHSCSVFEARQEGLQDRLRRFTAPPRGLMDVLDYADATASRAGRYLPAEHRLSEAVHRHQADPARHRALLMAKPLRQAAVNRMHQRLWTADHLPTPTALSEVPQPERTDSATCS